MRVLLVSFLYDSQSGGAPRVVETLARYLQSKSVEVTILASQGKKGVSIETDHGIKIIRFLPTNLYWVKDKDKHPIWKKVFWQLVDIWNPFVYKETKKLIANNLPDLVHVHKLRGLSPSIWTAARANHISVIHTAHDFELISPQGTLSGRIGRMVMNHSGLFKPYQQIRAGASNVVSAFTAPSHFVMNHHLTAGFFKQSDHQIIPNTHGLTKFELEVESSTFLETTSNQKNGLCFLYLGRLEREKGIDRFCQIFDRINREFPASRLEIAGIGSLANELYFRYSNHPAIHFLGSIQGSQKSSVLRSCDFVVVPSICQEAFGLSIIEAFAHHKPVIASNIGGIREIVKDGENGFLVDPEDENMWGATLRKAIQLSDKNCMQKNAQGAARQYAMEPIGNAYLDLYNKVLDKS
jgi:glycosyltransferase involved in cell wall biosynthesis